MLTTHKPDSLTPMSDASARGPREFLVFTLAGELYGLELQRVREILTPPTLTHVPRAPDDVLGVCSVRGLLVTVFDLRRRLNVEQRVETRASRVLLSESPEGEVVGLYVDDVRNVVRLADDEIEIAQALLGGDLSDYVLGVGRPGGEPIVLLDQRSLTE
jgi:chemotaxis signal transduction protein